MKFTKKDPIIIIGAGKISWSLVPSLQHAGYKINTIISRTNKDAKKLASTFYVKDYSDSLNNFKIKKGIFILAVPDSSIKSVADDLTELNIDFPGSLFVHVSGSQDISLLNSLYEKGAHTASFHIMQTFPSLKTRDIKNSFSAVETTSDIASGYLFKLAKNLKLNPFRINSADKVIYHLAGVYASNFINAVLYQSQKLSCMLNLKDYSFNDIFAPLFLSTIRNINKSGPVQALSGPVERGDPETVKKHIKALQELTDKNPDMLLSYLSLSMLLLQTAEEKSGSLNTGQLEIKQILDKELAFSLSF
jgi:predicted short-subunit dehydrogenase-like oxidoreductase (DUF2520 family)